MGGGGSTSRSGSGLFESEICVSRIAIDQSLENIENYSFPAETSNFRDDSIQFHLFHNDPYSDSTE